MQDNDNQHTSFAGATKTALVDNVPLLQEDIMLHEAEPH